MDIDVVDFQVRIAGGAPVALLRSGSIEAGPAMDLVRDDLGLVEERGLETAVMASLFTWRRADPDDVLPAGADRQGWWGDAYPFVEGDQLGSKLWLLLREVLTARTVARARFYAEAALQWLIDDRVADRVIVDASRSADPVRLNLGVRIVRGDRDLLNKRFVGLWDQMEQQGGA